MNEILLNNQIYQLETIHLSITDNPQVFFKEWLDNMLYKAPPPQSGFNSRMKRVYKHEKEWQGISATVAKKDGLPVGICLLEHRLRDDQPFVTQAGLLDTNSRKKDPWRIKLDWNYIHAGFMSFYVKESDRGQGLAKELLKEMEILQHSLFSQRSNDCMVVTCRELAQHLVEKSNLFYAVDCDTHQNNYFNNLSSLTYNIHFEESYKKSIGQFNKQKNLGNKL